MKIAFFPGAFLPQIGGAEIIAHNLAKGLSLLGYDITVFVHSQNSLELKKKFPHDFPYRIISLLPKSVGLSKKFREAGIKWGGYLDWQIKYYQKKYRFDLWHFSSISYQAFFCMKILEKLNIPVLGTCHGADIQIMNEVDYGLRRNRLFNELFTASINRFDMLTAISDTIWGEYRKLGICDSGVRKIGNGIDFERISSFKCFKEDIFNRFEIEGSKKIILTVGRNHPKKGFLLIPDIIRNLLAFRKDFLWIVVGKGNENLAEIVKKAGNEQFLKVIGETGKHSAEEKYLQFPSEDLLSFYKVSDVFVFPTILESFGVVLIEAMAAGVPVVTTDAPGPDEMITDKLTGLKSTAGDASKMACNINLLLSDQSLSKNICLAAYNKAACFSWPKIINKYVSVYKEIVAMKYCKINKK